MRRGIACLLALMLWFGSMSACADTTIDLSYSRYGVSEKIAVVTVTDEVVNTVRAGIFGANASYIGGAQIYDEATGLFDEVMLQKLRDSGVKTLRIPGGTEGDFFLWQQTVGPVETRIPQINPFADTDNGEDYLYDVRFGPDEWFDLCKRTGTALSIQLNAGNGTPEEAAAFVRYCLDSGVEIDDITVGNEVCMKGGEVFGVTVDKTQEEYITFYQQVWELMGEDMRRELAERGIPFGCIGLPMSHALHEHRYWDRDVLSAIGKQTDFIDIHIGYSPYFTDNSNTNEQIVKCLLASADQVRKHLDVELSTIERYAPDVKVAISEHGPLRGLPYSAGSAGGIFLASFFHVVLAEEKVISADYLPLTNHPAANNLLGHYEANGKHTYWDNVVTHVFHMYAAQIGRDVLNTQVTGAKTFSATPVGLMPGIRGVSEGDAAVYYNRVTGEGTLFLLNKAYKENTTFDVMLPFDVLEITAVTELFTPNYTMRNDWQRPTLVQPTVCNEHCGQLADNRLSITTKPVSLVRIDFRTEPATHAAQ